MEEGFSLKDFYYRHIRRNLKYLPIIGVILLVFLYFYMHQPANNVTTSNNPPASFIEKMKYNWAQFSNSFDFSNKAQLIFTIILIITIWTAYYYWGRRFRVIRHNPRLVQIILIAVSLLFFSKHILLNSLVGKYYDWGIFIFSAVAIVLGSVLLTKIINSINLASDLYCWGLRLLGVVFFFIGWIVLTSASFSWMLLSLNNVHMVSQNVLWILGVCLILLGAFCEFRSFRRFPMVGIWRA